MAAAVTLTSTTIEGQLVELITKIQMLERDSATNPDNANRVTGNANYDQGTFTGTFNLAITTELNTSGQAVTIAQEYLS